MREPGVDAGARVGEGAQRRAEADPPVLEAGLLNAAVGLPKPMMGKRRAGESRRGTGEDLNEDGRGRLQER